MKEKYWMIQDSQIQYPVLQESRNMMQDSNYM